MQIPIGKKLLILIMCLLTFFKSGFSQELGLRYGAALASDSTFSAPMGAGIFFITDDSANRTNLILSFDISVAKRQGPIDNEVEAARFAYCIGVIRGFQLGQNVKFKMGPTAGYQKTNTGVFYEGSFVGTGLIFNMKVGRIFHSSLNFDSFIIPEYLFHIGKYKEPDVLLVDFGLGISF